MAVGKNKTWNLGKGNHLLYNIKAVGKNIKRGGGEGDENLGEENQDLKKWRWGRISTFKELCSPLPLTFVRYNEDLVCQRPRVRYFQQPPYLEHRAS